MKTFEQIILEAKAVGDARTKATNELRAYAKEVFFKKVAEAVNCLDWKYIEVDASYKLFSNHYYAEHDGGHIETQILIYPDKEKGFVLKQGTNYNYYTREFESVEEIDSATKFSFYGLIFYMENTLKELVRATNVVKDKISRANSLMQDK